MKFKFLKIICGLIALVLIQFCNNAKKNTTESFVATLNELNPTKYPNNPDAATKHPKYEEVTSDKQAYRKLACHGLVN